MKTNRFLKPLLLTAAILVMAAFAFTSVAQAWECTPIPPPVLWSPMPVKMTDTTKYKKAPPWTIGFCNASISNSWRVLMEREVYYEAKRYPDLIKQLYVTDANDDPNKQISDMEDLVAKGCDLIILSAATMAALAPITDRVMKEGIPVILVDRIVATDNYVSYITASNAVQARVYMQWLCEYLKGQGNIVMLSGIAGAGPAEERLVPVRQEVLPRFPGIKVLAHEYTDWSPATGKKVQAALIQKYGKEIQGVWCDSGLQAAGSVEAFVEAGLPVPPHTGEDHNGFMKLVKKHNVPACICAYPVHQGAEAVRVAINVLQGIPVPYQNEVNRLISVTPGDDTCSVKAIVPFEQAVRPDLPDDWQVDNTLPEEYVNQRKMK